VSRSKSIGTAIESAVVKFLTQMGLNARRVALAGVNDEGDVHVVSPAGRTTVIECKGGKQTHNPTRQQVADWYQEAVNELANVGIDGDIPVLVYKRKGSGAANAHEWWAVLDLDDINHLRGGKAAIGGMLVWITLGDLAGLLKGAGY
jgi:hypothetical protein